MEPWGTLQVINCVSDNVLPIFVDCSLDDKYDLNHPVVLDLKPKSFSLSIDITWSTVSNALAKKEYNCHLLVHASQQFQCDGMRSRHIDPRSEMRDW